MPATLGEFPGFGPLLPTFDIRNGWFGPRRSRIGGFGAAKTSARNESNGVGVGRGEVVAEGRGGASWRMGASTTPLEGTNGWPGRFVFRG